MLPIKANAYLGSKFKRDPKEPLKFENQKLKEKWYTPPELTNHSNTETLVKLEQIAKLIGTNRK
jgi:hypothetical protein